MRYFLLIVTIIASCQQADQPLETKDKITKYYDLVGLINKQIKLLETENPIVNKTVVIDKEEEIINDTIADWAKELALFANADINKPKLLTEYTTKEYDNASGDKVTSYELIDQKSPGIVKIQIINTNTGGGLKSVYIESCEYNVLFSSEIEMMLNFDGKPDPKLESYRIGGYEKVLLKDTLNYAIASKLL